MSCGPRTLTALYALTGVFLALAGVALFWPASVGDDATPPAGLEATRAGASARRSSSSSSAVDGPDAELARAVVASNIFSASRAAPAGRFDPYAAEPDPYGPPVADGSPPDGGSAAEAESVPRLYGTLVGPDGAAALLRLDPALPDARLYREGERGGAYTVMTIDDRSVVLAGPEGRIVLRLTRPRGPTP